MPAQRNKLRVISRGEDFGGHDITLVTYAALASVGARLIFRCAHDDDKIVFADGALHKMWELVTGLQLPLIEFHVDAILAKPYGQRLDPVNVRRIIPGV